jgi:hypothetical protein
MTAQKHRFIPGIYNYCDYWCERCAFTRRCRNFGMARELERETRGGKPVEDATNAAFWNGLAGKLRETTVFGRAAEWADDDMDGFDAGPDPEWQAREAAHRGAVHGHALTRLAEEYLKQAGAWLKSADADLKAHAHRLLEAAGSPFAQDDLEEEARRIGETIEVVAWYHTFIAPKMSRAVSGLLERDEAGGAADDVLRESRLCDANGSGKVTLVAIELSIAAWLHLRDALPGQESAILNMLALLDRMRRGIRAALPGAQSFRRPGFDGGPEDDEAETGGAESRA